MNIEENLQQVVIKAVSELYGKAAVDSMVQVQKTKKEFEGDLTIVVFPLLKLSAKKPEDTASEIGEYIIKNWEHAKKFNVVKGFLNITLKSSVITELLLKINSQENFGITPITEKSKKILLEFSSPNTNKPLHLGHLRNNFLGDSISRILKAGGNNVIKVNLVNDRGIHICKSMLAWQKWGNGETPETSGLKGDHLIGKYYVLFDQHYKEEIKNLIAQGLTEEQAKQQAPSIIEAHQMLQKWESGDKETVALWKKMNNWVYDGFDVTYKLMGISFDKIYHESETYLEGKSYVLDALNKGICKKAEDGSVFVDLTEDGLDQKILLRSDGTTVYMTQDLGTAAMRYREFGFDQHIYVVGNEQDYHFKALKLVLKKMGFSWSDAIKHFSYGMVELPNGKMKSREGTVVDADDLIAEMTETARKTSEELGKLNEMSKEQQDVTVSTIAMAALKYFILKVDPRKTILFNPAESIDFNGNTGPFVLYTYARIRSIFRKLEEKQIRRVTLSPDYEQFSTSEAELVKRINDFPGIIAEACNLCSPAQIANYVYDLCKLYNQFYHDCQIVGEENDQAREFRIILSDNTSKVIAKCLNMLGINVLEKM
ncbi:MAG: arginine--tRNA ligase [Bacteroidales bacterium]|nr:arginine--tRNA ligase [Bacteroidales bacterium]